MIMVKEVAIGFPVGSINGVLTTVLLGVRQRNIGRGLWMPYGGEIEPGESPLTCCIREIKEECGLICAPEDVEFAGEMQVTYFSARRTSQAVQSQMSIYMHLIHDWMGKPRNSVEMTHPTFFPLRHLPVQNMLEGTVRMLNRIITGRTVYATMAYQLPKYELTAFSMIERHTRFPRPR